MRPVQKSSNILPTCVVAWVTGAPLSSCRQAEAVVPGDPLQTEQGGSGTEANDGMARVQDAPQSGLCSRIELDLQDREPVPGCVDDRRHLAGHLKALVDEQGVDRTRLSVAPRG